MPGEPTPGMKYYQEIAPGVAMDQAQLETSRILTEAWPSRHPDALLLPRVAEEVRGLGSPILLLFSATGVLLLIACGSVAVLSLGETHGRVHEVATRVAIGAGNRRILRQLLTESLVLGVAGSIVGALVALAMSRGGLFSLRVKNSSKGFASSFSAFATRPLSGAPGSGAFCLRGLEALPINALSSIFSTNGSSGLFSAL